jgi:hypothetical protein
MMEVKNMATTNQQLVKQLDAELARQNAKLAERNQQLEMQLRLAQKPQRTSLVESNNTQQTHTSNGYTRFDRSRNALSERVAKYDLSELADRESPLPPNFNIDQALKDFGLMRLFKDGAYSD